MSNATQHTTAVPTADAAGAPTDDATAGTPAADAAGAPDAAAATNGVAELTPEALQRIYDWARDTFDEEAAEFFVTRLEAASPDQVRVIVAEALANHPTHDDLRTVVRELIDERVPLLVSAEVNKALRDVATRADLEKFPTREEVNKQFESVNAQFESVNTRFDNFATKADLLKTKADLLEAFNSLTWKLIRFSVGYSLALSSLVFAIARYL